LIRNFVVFLFLTFSYLIVRSNIYFITKIFSNIILNIFIKMLLLQINKFSRYNFSLFRKFCLHLRANLLLSKTFLSV
uniref:Ovule protein n=1 Tax=Strongyloides papillosus TaxID=174720 RepID=A0A0N5B644_STREA